MPPVTTAVALPGASGFTVVLARRNSTTPASAIAMPASSAAIATTR
jgi:hypothetical protein